MRRRFNVSVLILSVFFSAACSQNLLQTKPGEPEDADRSGSQVKAQKVPPGREATGEKKDESNRREGAAGEKPAPSPIKNAQRMLDEALEFCDASQDFWALGQFENAIAALDQAYELILHADTGDDVQLLQQKEDIRFLISKRMLEIYASRHTVANGNHKAIPMVMNRYVQQEIQRFQGPERQFFIESYKRSGRYRREILRDIKNAGLPEELSWLPLIESGFKIKALSRARALGLWQFIPSTGYKFGLKRDYWVDERMNVKKSTEAAIAYLQELHKIFGDWCTVLAAYNCGEVKVLRVIRSQNINYLDNFWDLFERLPLETARYVPRFLAALHILKDPSKFGFDLPEPDPPLAYDSIIISKQVRLSDVAKVLGAPRKSLEMLNPELRYRVTPPTPYGLKVPEGMGGLLMAKLEEIPASPSPVRHYAFHRVRRGETLSHLAQRYRTSVRTIMLANNLRSPHLLRVGQKLKIPLRGGPIPPKKTGPVPSAASLRPHYHTVRRGDSLWLIARRYHTDVRQIMLLNNLEDTNLHIGQRLLIWKGREAEAAREDMETYRVKAGDSPYQIAVSHNMKLERFLRINGLTPLSKIYPGQLMLVDAK